MYIIFSIRDNIKVMECKNKRDAEEQLKIIIQCEIENDDYIKNSYKIMLT